MAIGWLQIDGIWYFFDDNGHMYSSQWLGWSGSYYYFLESGAMNTATVLKLTNYGITRYAYFYSSGVWRYTVSLSGWDLVDSGKHLDWGGKSAFESYVITAANKWNACKSGVIRKDTATTIQDVTISDINNKDKPMATTFSSGKIEFNLYYMPTSGDYNKTLQAVMHEFGHALGLNHNDSYDVMYYLSNSITNLSTSDIQSYYAAYNQY